jgi:XTP/dITP diphosphohydrolase
VKVYLATKNAGKTSEMQAILSRSLLVVSTYADYEDVDETAGSYAGNALLKAHTLARQLREAGIEGAALADDSGLEVAALGGRPGVYSARYGGVEASWTQRRALLLDALQGVPWDERGARFVCSMALVEPNDKVVRADGAVDGFIAELPCGTGGFGYDPVFWYPPRGCTFAQLTAENKNAVSHRRAAAEALLASLCGRK